jgi:phosphotransferase system  glucose/maltose/N-acetylglucosamine-specific IIC component
MKPSRVALAVTVFTVFAATLLCGQAPSPSATPSALAQPAPVHAPASTQQSSTKITAYTLPPDLHEKAHHRNRIHFRLALIGVVYGILALWLILRWKLAPKYRNWSERFSSKRFVQSVLFSPLLLATIAILTLPVDLDGEWVEKQYGISVQGWGSWTWDWVKAQLISFVIGTILIWLLYLVIRRSSRRWWFYFWLISLPIGVFLVFLQPLVVDPLSTSSNPCSRRTLP